MTRRKWPLIAAALLVSSPVIVGTAYAVLAAVGWVGAGASG